MTITTDIVEQMEEDLLQQAMVKRVKEEYPCSYKAMDISVKFKCINSLVVFMALECIDEEFGYQMYSDYMDQYPMTGKLPESRYDELYNIVLNR